MNNKASRSGASGKARSNQGQDRDPAQEAPLSSPLTTDDASARLLALLARNIRQLRGQRAMTRKGLAAQSGVSLPHLARLESSQGNVSVVILDKVA
ncbi:MAG TPA: helix-turn-helix domain-containing protein, partial [Rhodocyclaceae bacterium]|nr:helix-turn-helix domain-containing protein [Rhodocyclaceae bacterium]